MINAEMVLRLVKECAEKKRLCTPGLYAIKKDDGVKKKIPDYYPGYQQKVRDYDRIRVHAEPGYFPKELFENRSPNQQQRELDYIESTYEQKTIDVFIDFVNTVGRIFHDSNWAIKYNTEADKYISAGLTFQNYVETGIDEFGSVEIFIKEMLPTVKLRDAEGVIAVVPEFELMPTEEGETVIDESKLPKPQPYYYRCDQVVSFSDDYYLIELDKKSIVNYGGANHRTGLIYQYHDKSGIYQIEQTGKYSDMMFVIAPVYIHDYNQLFVYKLKGIPVYKQGILIWQSQFLYACSQLNSAILDEANLRVSKNMCVYPYRVQLGDICQFDYVDGNGKHSICDGGQVFDSVKELMIACPSCNGVGSKSRISPMGVMLLKPKTNTSDGDSTFSGDPLKYVSPETATLELLRKESDNAITKARGMLHLIDTTSEVKGSEDMTATGQFMDMKAMYAFIRPISDQIFGLYESILDGIGLQRYGNDYAGIELAYPVTFDFQTTADYISDIKALMEAGAPPFMIQAVMMRFLRALFYNEKTAASAFELLAQSDRLISMNQTDIAYGVSKGLIAPYEAILHDSGISFINAMFLEDDKFFEQDFIIQKQKLIEYAKAKAAEVAPATEGQTLINSLLNA